MVVSELIRVECEQCGKKYGIDSVHVKGDGAKIRCFACQSDIMVPAAGAAAPTPAAELPAWVEEVDDISMPALEDPHAGLIAELSETEDAEADFLMDWETTDAGAASKDDAIADALSILEGDDEEDSLDLPDWDIAGSTADDTLTGFREELEMQAELDLKTDSGLQIQAELDLGEALDKALADDLELEGDLDFSSLGDDDTDLDLPDWSLDDADADSATIFPEGETDAADKGDIELVLPEWALRKADEEPATPDDAEAEIELVLPRWALRSPKAPETPEAPPWDETDTLAGLLVEGERDESESEAPDWAAVGETDEASAFFAEALGETPDEMEASFDAAPSMPLEPETATVAAKTGGLGLTSKFLLATLIPLFIISIISILLVTRETVDFQQKTMDQSMGALQDISEGLINQMAVSVARQARQHLLSRPDLAREDFNKDLSFKRVVLQSIGRTGSTGLYEISASEQGWRFWVHFDSDIVGRDLQTFREELKDEFEDFWSILSGVEAGKRSVGYSKWPDENGELRDVYMVCQPVQGTPYAVAAVMFEDEINRPLRRIEETGETAVKNIWRFNGLIMGVGFLLIALILYFYSRGITDKIRQLRRLAEKIGVGDMDATEEIITTRDELGDLSRSITEMQENVRRSVERMRRRLR